MSRDELFRLYDEIVQEARDTMSAKNQDYAEGGDCLANLREAARDNDLSPEKVWSIYFDKQLRAIKAHVNGKSLKSESLRSRIVDCINFLVLLEALSGRVATLETAESTLGWINSMSKQERVAFVQDFNRSALTLDCAGENGSGHTGPLGFLGDRLAL